MNIWDDLRSQFDELAPVGYYLHEVTEEPEATVVTVLVDSKERGCFSDSLLRFSLIFRSEEGLTVEAILDAIQDIAEKELESLK